MKSKRFVVIMFAILLIVVLPTSAFALSSSSAGSYNYNYAANQTGKSARDFVISFADETEIGYKDTWNIYAAPALNAVRGAGGKASVYTSEGVDSAGWHGAWLLVRYEKSNGGFRVGWVPSTQITSGRIQATRNVNFAYWTVTLEENCMLTDDPLLESEALAYASAGEQLTYLAYYRFNGGREYAYVQGELDGRPVCGFIPFNAIAW
ncbi:MAG: hypothetical protein IJB85_03800 [Clostridia bacterium]|nr:hypothetical protein [Clostridia bacterium]